MKKAIFSDRAMQQQFDEKGAVKAPFLNKQVVAELKAIFDELHPEKPEMMLNAYYFSVFGPGKTYMQAIYDRCVPILMPYLNDIFTDFKILAVIMQMKGKGENSVVNPHQDLTVLDERKYHALTFWIPLSDSVENNGPLYFLEKSHLAFRNMRCHTMEYQYGDVQDYIIENSTRYLAETGEAIVFDPATIHYSPPNTSGVERASIAVSIVSKEAPLHIYYRDKLNLPNGPVEKYEVPDNFWYLYENFEQERELKPAFGKKTELTGGFRFSPYGKNEFIEKYKEVLS